MLDHFSGTTPVYDTSTATFDAYDRQLTGTDTAGVTTTIAYTPATGVPASVKTTDPLGRVTTTTVNLRGETLSTVDPNGRTTSTDYDALGRPVAAWLPGRAKTLSANTLYAYAPSRSAPTAVTTRTLLDDLVR